MFRKELQEKLEAIFGYKKSTYNAPSEAFEQDTLFIDIDQPNIKIREGRQTARVRGYLTVYFQMEKQPYGFIHKRIEQAGADLKKDFFFFDVDQDQAASPARLINIVERRTSFVFLYSAQYDPNQGHITTLEMECNP